MWPPPALKLAINISRFSGIHAEALFVEKRRFLILWKQYTIAV
jgi:hypothetical protein